MTAGPITALVAMNPFFLQLQNSTPAPVGQAFTNQPIRNLSPPKKTQLFLCVESRLYVANAMRTSAMCSKTGLNLLAFGIALTPLLWILKNLKRPSLPKSYLRIIGLTTVPLIIVSVPQQRLLLLGETRTRRTKTLPPRVARYFCCP
jgi:hypothetical protein